MSYIPLFIFTCVTWSAWASTAISDVRLKELLRNVPKHERRTVSIFPIIPVCPILAHYAAKGIDALAPLWGTRLVFAVHVILLLLFSTYTVRYCLQYRKELRRRQAHSETTEPSSPAE